MEGVEMRWWQGAEVFQGGYGVEDGVTTTPGFQDTLDDILPRLAFQSKLSLLEWCDRR